MSQNNLTEEQLQQLGEELTNACRNGDLDSVKTILKAGADIHYNEDEAVIFACQAENFELVKYLLSSKELKEHCSVHAGYDRAYRKACEMGNLEMVKFTLSSPDLKEHSPANACYGEGFEKAFYNGHMDVMVYLALEHNMLEAEPVRMLFSREPEGEKEVRAAVAAAKK